MMNYTVESLLEDAIFLVGDGYSVLLQENILVYKHAPEPCFGDLISLKQEKEKKRMTKFVLELFKEVFMSMKLCNWVSR